MTPHRAGKHLEKLLWNPLGLRLFLLPFLAGGMASQPCSQCVTRKVYARDLRRRLPEGFFRVRSRETSSVFIRAAPSAGTGSLR
jgi:hypothetical protein